VPHNKIHSLRPSHCAQVLLLFINADPI